MAACAGGDKNEGKGIVDDSAPPSIPTEAGKADGAATKVVAISVASAHPYTNNLDKVFPVALSVLPSCAHRARLHFKVLRTEASYDFVTVEPTGGATQSFDGTKDNTWTAWFDIAGPAAHVNVRLATDASVTRQGFEIDAVEWDGGAICTTIAWPACGAGTVDVNPPPAVCGCPSQPKCDAIGDIAIRHELANGRNRTANSTAGDVLSETHPGPTDAAQTTVIGKVDRDRLAALVRHAATSGLASYTHPIATGAVGDTFTITAPNYTVSFVAAQGSHATAVAALIAEFDALARCDDGGGSTCDSGFACDAGACLAQATCTCTADANPVCGVNGHTYGNACEAGCASAPVAHPGACGIAGDACGTLFGLVCTDDGAKCRFGVSKFDYPFPDAGGVCVGKTYCDAPTDCTALPHPAVLGSWACNVNACAWQAGAQWQAVTDGAFATAHPYASSTSVWKELYLPATAQAMRLNVASFDLEAGYDFLEVWSWTNNAWVLDHRYTGTTGPAKTEEFAGRYHYLRFVSDSSVNNAGFALTSDWR